MMDSVLPEILQIAADVFSVPIDAICAKSSPDSLEGWDSIKHINLMMAIEQAFNVEITPEELAEVRSIGDAAELVGGKLA